MGTTLLVDGNSLTYRAFFALPTDMATASGQVTNAVFGFTSMLAYVLKEQQPDGILVAFDRPEPTFRHEAEPEYKAQRAAAPDILRQQMGLVREVLDALGITTVDEVGWEADDLIATATRQLVERGENVIIVTGDRDSYQLVSDPHVQVMYNKRGVSDYALYDEAGIEEKTGVTPEMYVQYAALRGDNSDNLPGVPGVGEKTAAKLINKYGGLDGIFANVDEQTPKLKTNLIENEQRARKNLELMVLHFDAPLRAEVDGEQIDIDFDDRAAPTGLGVSPNPEEMKRLFDFLEFRALGGRITEALASLGGEVDLGPGEERQEIVAEVTVLEAASDAASLIAVAEHLDLAAAWTGEPGRSFLSGVAVVSDGSASEVAWIPSELLGDEAVGAALAAHESVRGHNIKEAMRSLLGLGIEMRGLTLDTAIAAYLIDPAEARYTLPDLIEKYTGFARPSDAAASGQLDLDGTSMTDAEVAGRDALAVHHLAGPIHDSLEAQGMAELYDTIENPLVLVLAKMEHFGVGVDIDELRALNDRLKAEVESLAAELRSVSGKEDLNLNSPKQLRELLYDEKGLTPIKKTKTGPSTDAATLEKLLPEWPEFLGPLMRHREVDKLPRHVRRGPAARSGRRRPHPRDLQSDCRQDRAALLGPTESAQHPGAQRARATVPQGVRAITRHRVARGRLQPDRAALHRTPCCRSRLDRGVHERSGHPQRHRSARVRRRARRGHARTAVEGEDGLLRSCLRHGGLWAGPAPQHPSRRSGADPRCLFRGVPEREGLHGLDRRRGARARLHRNAVRSAPPDPRTDELELPCASGR